MVISESFERDAGTASLASAELAAFKAASSTVQLQKAAKALATLLEQSLPCGPVKCGKKSAELFIEAFNAAYERIGDASRDPGRFRAALRVARAALRGLQQCRSIIKGRNYAIEIQHYSLVRRLISVKAYSEVRRLF